MSTRRRLFFSSLFATLMSLAYAAIALAGDGPGPTLR